MDASDVQPAHPQNSTVMGAHFSTGADTADDNSIPHRRAQASGMSQFVAAPKGGRCYTLADGRDFVGQAHPYGK
jgi:hypothetical protein